jgi:hypothetical protein
VKKVIDLRNLLFSNLNIRESAFTSQEQITVPVKLGVFGAMKLFKRMRMNNTQLARKVQQLAVEEPRIEVAKAVMQVTPTPPARTMQLRKCEVNGRTKYERVRSAVCVMKSACEHAITASSTSVAQIEAENLFLRLQNPS